MGHTQVLCDLTPQFGGFLKKTTQNYGYKDRCRDLRRAYAREGHGADECHWQPHIYATGLKIDWDV